MGLNVNDEPIGLGENPDNPDIQTKPATATSFFASSMAMEAKKGKVGSEMKGIIRLDSAGPTSNAEDVSLDTGTAAKNRQAGIEAELWNLQDEFAEAVVSLHGPAGNDPYTLFIFAIFIALHFQVEEVILELFRFRYPMIRPPQVLIDHFAMQFVIDGVTVSSDPISRIKQLYYPEWKEKVPSSSCSVADDETSWSESVLEYCLTEFLRNFRGFLELESRCNSPRLPWIYSLCTSLKFPDLPPSVPVFSISSLPKEAMDVALEDVVHVLCKYSMARHCVLSSILLQKHLLQRYRIESHIKKGWLVLSWNGRKVGEAHCWVHCQDRDLDPAVVINDRLFLHGDVVERVLSGNEHQMGDVELINRDLFHEDEMSAATKIESDNIWANIWEEICSRNVFC